MGDAAGAMACPNGLRVCRAAIYAAECITGGIKAAEYAAALHIHSNVSINGAIQTRSYVKEYECPYCGQISKIAYLAVEVIPYSIEYGANCTLPDPQERGEESDETDEISGSFDSESD